MQTVIECGANRGDDTFRLAQLWPHARIFAIEPTRELVEQLAMRFQGQPNIHICPFAIDATSGTRQFHVAGHSDWGCSSLHAFAPDLAQEWPGRADFFFTHAYPVPTVTLADLCVANRIDSIDYLWLDAQGSDFAALKSLGPRIDAVKAGRCEVARSVELYAGTDNRIEVVRPWLIERGFQVNTVPDATGAEADLHFHR